MAINDVILVSLKTVFGAIEGFNIRPFRSVSTIGPPMPLAQAAIAAEIAMTSNLKALMAANSEYQFTRVQKILPGPPSLPVVSGANAGPGLVAGEALPSQVCGLIKLTTEFAGRRFRGRFYSPFPSETDNDVNGRPIADFVNRLSTMGTSIINGFTATDGVSFETWLPALLHRNDMTTTFVIGFASRSLWATQRRRAEISGTP